MLRFYYVIIVSIPFIIYYLIVATYYCNHEDRFDEIRRYKLAQRMVRRVGKNGRIKTEVTGIENLPGDGGYLMYSNHQGKWDALGILQACEKPSTVVIEKKASKVLITNQIINLIHGYRLDRSDMRAQMKMIQQIAKDAKAGRKILIFPEGGYDKNKNEMREFMPGAFKCASMSGVPIIPIAIYDSYKPFSVNSLKRVTTYVSFLPPISYEEYKGMNTREVAELVKEKIQEEINVMEARRACV